MDAEHKLETAVRAILQTRGKIGIGTLVAQLRRRDSLRIDALWKLLARMEQQGEAIRTGPPNRAYWELAGPDGQPVPQPEKPRHERIVKPPAAKPRAALPKPVPQPGDLELEDPADFAPEYRASPPKPQRDPRMRNISRVDHEPKNSHGFFVRVAWKHQKRQKFFADHTYGGRDAALDAAIAWRDATLVELGKPIAAGAYQPRPGDPGTSNTGISGITRAMRSGYPFFVVTWREPDGRRRQTSYSIGKHGEAGAMQLALARLSEAMGQKK